jgi:hypothetical protein
VQLARLGWSASSLVTLGNREPNLPEIHLFRLKCRAEAARWGSLLRIIARNKKL